MDGAVNAMLTLKMGYLAKRRCRAFEGWSARQARSISAEALERVKKESGSVATDLLKRCGGLTSRAAWAALESVPPRGPVVRRLWDRPVQMFDPVSLVACRDRAAGSSLGPPAF